MKHLLSTLVLLVLCLIGRSQTLTIDNQTGCSLNYRFVIADPAFNCTHSSISQVYNVPGNSTLTFPHPNAVNWDGDAPNPGWQYWQIHLYTGCNMNQMAFGTGGSCGKESVTVATTAFACTTISIPPTGCAKMDPCNGCSMIHVDWVDLGGGNALVKIY